MGIVQNVIGMVRDINDRKRVKRVDDQLKNYMVDPAATISAIMDIDPRTGMVLSQQRTAEAQASEDRARKNLDSDLGMLTRYMRGVGPEADIGEEFDQLAPFLRDSVGMAPERIAAFRQAAVANPKMFMDDEAFKKWAGDQYSTTIVTPGSIALRGGKEVARAPYKMDSVSTSPGSIRAVFDPNTGKFVTPEPGSVPPGGTGPLTVERLRPLFVAQESADNYTAVNKETGALGRYQIMPQTGMALARKLGMPWRPDMMVKDDDASRNYQDALGNAAIQESIDFGNGDAATTFSHYYAGPNRRGWGPRTRKYTQEMLARLNAAGGVPPTGITPTAVSVPPKPPAPGKGGGPFRAATAEELAGYPEGTAAQVDTSSGKLVNIRAPSVSVAKNLPSARRERATALVDTLTRFNEDLIHLRQHPGLQSALGFISGRLPGAVLGQSAQDAINLIENLQKRVGLDELMKFKATSAQGASGFGNLSNEEGRRLEAAFGSLDRTNSFEEFTRVLDRMLRINTEVLKRQTAGFKSGVAEDTSNKAGPKPGAVVRGWRFNGGDASDRRNWSKL